MTILQAIRGLALLVALALPGTAPAQFAPEVLVNGRAITGYELDQRALLLEAFGVREGARDLAEEQLINERLQVQAAEEMGVELQESAVDEAFGNFATARELTSEQVIEALEARGIAVESMRTFLRLQLLFREVVTARFRDLATPSDSDVELALEFQRKAPRESVLLQEIAIPNVERGPEATLELAQQLARDLNAGASFGAAVARYSKAPSAARGGRLDWIEAENLPPALAGPVLALSPGQVTGAIDIQQGVTILKLLDLRTEPPIDDGRSAETVVYSQLVIPLAPGASPAAAAGARVQARGIERDARFCGDLDRRAEEFGIGSGRSEPTPVSALPPELAPTIAGLEPGEKRVIQDDRGVSLVMLCERGTDPSPEQLESLKRRLFGQRMTALGRGLLDDMRAEAVIERR